jgi:hypothetical protein
MRLSGLTWILVVFTITFILQLKCRMVEDTGEVSMRSSGLELQITEYGDD